jgi:DNA polymerase II small subunit/DNA polymerase delta subunit B
MREEMVKKALEAGIMLTPGLLDELDENKLEEMIVDAKRKSKSLLTEREKQSKSKLVVKASRIVPSSRMGTGDFTKYYNNKYNGIRKLLLKKMDAMSINKVSGSYDDVSIIGMIRESIPGGFILEDPTGEIEVISENPYGMDDVIGVRGITREGKIIAKEIVFPDVPLDNHPRKLNNISILLTTSLMGSLRKHVESTNFTLIPNLGSEALDEKEKMQVITNFTNPTRISISSGGAEIRILIYKPEKDMNQKQAVDYLRKRHLSPQRNRILSQEDHFLIDPIPDILWLIAPKKYLENYKGVTLISCESPHAAVVNLETREVRFEHD